MCDVESEKERKSLSIHLLLGSGVSHSVAADGPAFRILLEIFGITGRCLRQQPGLFKSAKDDCFQIRGCVISVTRIWAT